MEDRPTKTCTQCGETVTKAGYAKRQWKREEPMCRLCAESTETSSSQQHQTKTCVQCNEDREKDQYPKKQWKKEHPVCRVCFELTNISEEHTRACRECKLDLPRNQYNAHQWAKGADALCHSCRALYEEKFFSSIGT
ncbi:hypothetical protein ACHAXR_000845, partial [Thalassiosira sp. AJA248-18]